MLALYIVLGVIGYFVIGVITHYICVKLDLSEEYETVWGWIWPVTLAVVFPILAINDAWKKLFKGDPMKRAVRFLDQKVKGLKVTYKNWGY